MRIRRDRFGSPCLTIVDAATAQRSFNATQHVSVAQVGQRHPQQMPRMGWFVGQNGLRLTPTCAMIVASQYHRAMGVITTHEHQQPVFLRHVNDVRHGNNAIPILGDNLEPGRNDLFRGTTREATDFIHFPTDGRGLWLKQEAIHHDRLVGLTVSVVAADMPEDEDPAVLGLHRARIIGRARDVELVPGLARVAGPVDAAGRDVEYGTLQRLQ